MEPQTNQIWSNSCCSQLIYLTHQKRRCWYTLIQGFSSVLWMLWNISLQVKLFADALDSGSFDKHSSPLIIQAGSFETHPLHHFLILTISIILLILFILIPTPPHPQSVRGGVKLHINVYWLPTVSNKKWDLLGQKARGPSIYSKSEPKLSKAPPTGDLFASRLPFSDLIGFSSSTPHPTLFCFLHLTVASSLNGLM